MLDQRLLGIFGVLDQRLLGIWGVLDQRLLGISVCWISGCLGVRCAGSAVAWAVRSIVGIVSGASCGEAAATAAFPWAAATAENSKVKICSGRLLLATAAATAEY